MPKRDDKQIRARLAQVASQQEDVTRRLMALLGDPEAGAGEIGRLRREHSRLAAEQERLFTDLELARLDGQEHPAWHRAHGDPMLARAVSGKRPMRELALDVIEEIGVPAAPRTVSDFAGCFGLSLPSARFSSLRRDEQRAYMKDPLSRPAWVVPGIHAVGLSAIPRLVCSSAWPDERRAIGSRTLHANHLRTVLALLAAAQRAPRLGEANAEKARALMVRYAASVPGALEFGEEPDRGRIEEAVRAELEHVEASDEEERLDAAERMATLSDFHRLWGRPVAVGGIAEGGAG